MSQPASKQRDTKTAKSALTKRDGSAKKRLIATSKGEEMIDSSREGSASKRDPPELLPIVPSGVLAAAAAAATASAAGATEQFAIMTKEQLDELEALGGDLDKVFARLATFLSISNWNQDLFSNLHVSFHLQNYLFATQSNFSKPQTSLFCGILRAVLDHAVDRNLQRHEALRLFKDLLLVYSTTTMTPTTTTDAAVDPADDDDATTPQPIDQQQHQQVFGPRQVRSIVAYGLSSVFDHYTLLLHVHTSEQETARLHAALDLVGIPEVAALQDAVTEEVYEARQAAVREDVEAARVRACREAEVVRLSLINPFEALDSDSIRAITSEVVRSVMIGVTGDFEQMITTQKEKFMDQIVAYKD